MREWLHKLISALAVVALAFSVTAFTPGCEYEDDAVDDDAVEESIEEGGEALEEGGDALEEGAGEVGEEL